MVRVRTPAPHARGEGSTGVQAPHGPACHCGGAPASAQGTAGHGWVSGTRAAPAARHAALATTTPPSTHATSEAEETAAVALHAVGHADHGGCGTHAGNPHPGTTQACVTFTGPRKPWHKGGGYRTGTVRGVRTLGADCRAWQQVLNSQCERQTGMRVWGVGCGVWGVGCGVWGVGCGVWGVGCGVWGMWALWLPRGCVGRGEQASKTPYPNASSAPRAAAGQRSRGTEAPAASTHRKDWDCRPWPHAPTHSLQPDGTSDGAGEALDAGGADGCAGVGAVEAVAPAEAVWVAAPPLGTGTTLPEVAALAAEEGTVVAVVLVLDRPGKPVAAAVVVAVAPWLATALAVATNDPDAATGVEADDCDGLAALVGAGVGVPDSDIGADGEGTGDGD
jgi:hypothetical protein